MKIKTSELAGAALSYAVAIAQGWVTFPSDSGEGSMYWYCDAKKAPYCRRVWLTDWEPSVGSQGDGIIDREKIGVWPRSTLDWPDSQRWSARMYGTGHEDDYGMLGPTRRIAALRCFVASKLGDEVDIPEELT